MKKMMIISIILILFLPLVFSKFVNTFNNNFNNENVTWTDAGTQYVYLNLTRNSTVFTATFNLTGNDTDGPTNLYLDVGDSDGIYEYYDENFTKNVEREVVDSTNDVGWYSSIALDSKGFIHMSYFDSTSSDLKYCNNTGGSWSCMLVDIIGVVGKYSSIAIDQSDNIHISYFDDSVNELKYCNNTAIEGSWSCLSVDDSSASVGEYSSIALDSNNFSHITHLDNANNNLKYCNNTGGSWSCMVIDSGGLFASIAIDQSDNIHLSHEAPPTRYCNNTGGSWSCTVLPTSLNTFFSTMALDSSDNIHIVSYDYGVERVIYCNNTGGSWSCTEVVYSSGTALYPSITIDKSDKVHFSYFDNNDAKLKYCNNTGGSWSCSNLFYANTYQLGYPCGRAMAIKQGQLSSSVNFSNDVHLSWYNNTNLQYTKLSNYVRPDLVHNTTNQTNDFSSALNYYITNNCSTNLTCGVPFAFYSKNESKVLHLDNLFIYSHSNSTLEKVNMTPSPATSSESLNCSFVGTDVDTEDILNATISWYVNDTINWSETIEVDNSVVSYSWVNFSDANFTDGDKVTCQIYLFTNNTDEDWIYLNSSTMTIGDGDSPYSLNNTQYTASLTLGNTQTILVDLADTDSGMDFAKLSYTSTGGTNSNISMTKINETQFSLSFTANTLGTWTIDEVYFGDSSGNTNDTVIFDETFTVSAAEVGGGSGGGDELKALGEACEFNADCESLLCDTMVTLTCVESLCGNGYCDEHAGEDINNCAQDCSTFQRFSLEQAVIAKYAALIGIALVFILSLKPEFYDKFKKRFIMGGKRKRR